MPTTTSQTRNCTSSTELAGLSAYAWANVAGAAANGGAIATTFADPVTATNPINGICGAFAFPPLTTINSVKLEVTCQADIPDSCIIMRGYLTKNAVITGTSEDDTKPVPIAWDTRGFGDTNFGLTSAQLMSWATNKFCGFRFEIDEFAGLGPTFLEVDGMFVTVNYTYVHERLRNLLGCGR